MTTGPGEPFAATPEADGATAGASDGAVYVFRMPSLGADMEAGTLVEWRISTGDHVARGDVVAVVDTEKTDIEVEIFATGEVTELLVEPGATLPVGTPMARIRTVEAIAAEPAAPQAAPTVAEDREPLPAREAAWSPLPPRRGAPPAAIGRPLASPAARSRAAALGVDLRAVAGSGPSDAVVLRDLEALRRAPTAPPAAEPPHLHVHPVARKMAADLGIDLAQVAGTGISHAVTKADVERAARARPSPPAAAKPPSTPTRRGARRVLAAAMSRANREIPHYYLRLDVDLSRTLGWLEETNARRPVTERLLPAAVLLAAVARAAAELPEMNGSWTDEGFRPAARVHLGVAVSRRDGEVVVPAIHDADRLSLGALMAALRDLVQRARAGSLRSSEVADATLTVTNLGDLGVDAVHGVIYPPQVALVGFGRIRERPWVADGQLVVRPLVTATLAADHRASDGYAGGRFLSRIADLLADPASLLDPGTP